MLLTTVPSVGYLLFMRTLPSAENRTPLCQRVPLNKHPTQLAPRLLAQHTSHVIKQRQTNENKLVAFQLLCSAPLFLTHKHTALLSDRQGKERNINARRKSISRVPHESLSCCFALRSSLTIQTHA